MLLRHGNVTKRSAQDIITEAEDRGEGHMGHWLDSKIRPPCGVAMKRDFLVVYDYGMGGIWAIIHARSKDEITQKYPRLSVQEMRPAWMSDEVYSDISSTRRYDIDDPPRDWLLSIIVQE
jgi:hypothetical protein